VPAKRLTVILEPIQAYCVLETLPPLTALVVDKTTGLPLDDFFEAADLPCAQAEVYAGDWLRIQPPRADLLLSASEGMVARRARAGHDIQFQPAEVKTPRLRNGEQ
jgi:hypothetical protein